MTIIGIDPGISGALGFLQDDGTLQCVLDMPVVKLGTGSEIDVVNLLNLISMKILLWECRAIVETQSPQPSQGVVASFRMGRNFGQLCAVLDVLGIPWSEVRPAKWKKAMGVTKDKSSSIVLARRLWPDAPLTRKKDDGRAEALLIAEWGRRNP